MNVWTSTDFEGHWPVGTAAVVVASTEAEARELLLAAMKECGLDNPDFSLQRLDLDRPHAVVLDAGDY